MIRPVRFAPRRSRPDVGRPDGVGSRQGRRSDNNEEPGSSQTDAPQAGSEADGADVPDLCSLLTTDDNDGATGVTFGEGAFNDTLSSAFQAICDWAATDDTFATVQTLIVPDTAAFEGNRSSADSAVSGHRAVGGHRGRQPLTVGLSRAVAVGLDVNSFGPYLGPCCEAG
jgi:hypothetical protein